MPIINFTNRSIDVMSGAPNSVNIFPITAQASLMFGILKNIQAKFTSRKVIQILTIFTAQLLPSYFCQPRAFSTIWKIPCITPQTMKVQLAPCHIPLTRKVTKIFQYVLALLQRLPPRGIYTCWVSHRVSEICHLLQKSVILTAR